MEKKPRYLNKRQAIAENPESCYSLVCARKNDKAIYTAYTDCLIEGSGERELIVVNASRHEELIFKNLKDKSYKVVNCMGEELERGKFASELFAVKVSLGGIVFVSPNESVNNGDNGDVHVLSQSHQLLILDFLSNLTIQSKD